MISIKQLFLSNDFDNENKCLDCGVCVCVIMMNDIMYGKIEGGKKKKKR